MRAPSLALWFDNFNRNYSPPPDPAKAVLPRETTVAMAVKMRLHQVVIWIHPSERLPAVARLEVQNADLDVAKTVQLV